MDGVLHDVANLSVALYTDLVNRLKLVSGVIINIKNRSQDGRFRIKVTNEKGVVERSIDVRVSVVPQKKTETIVLRLLGVGLKLLTVDQLGLREEIKETLLTAIAQPNGIVLTTGPTGSGKTTTLYTFLKHISTPEKKIITIEDPIEYEIPGITQTQISAKYSFADALRAILRQNPNVIMVGEIRDSETATTAVNAALTGHLVLSTLHTNDAAGIIPRLLELGVKPHLIPDVLVAGIAQRLVRRLCEYCKEQYQASPREREKILHALSVISPRARIEIPKEVPTLWRSRGCDKCFGLRYKGRISIYEVLTLTDSIRKLIAEGASAHRILAAAVDAGLITMYQDGVFKVFEGITDLEEVERVAGEITYLEELYESGTSQQLTRGIHIAPTLQEEVKKILPKGRETFEKMLTKAKFEEFLPRVTAYALHANATDIHFEADRESFLVRIRVDGVLEDIASMNKIFHQSVLSSLKILGGLATQTHKDAQEGRFSIYTHTATIDTRLSILPGGYGETAVVRVLRLASEIENLALADLGFRASLLPDIERVLSTPTGLILTTGPTSSGKTTTMYAMMKKLNVRGVKVITVEDPIEYRINGVIQTQVNPEEGYTFASALPALMRQNPNIIMIGEIRDKETADIAVQASNTGHLVLSTIHVNSAAAVFERFEALGVESRTVAASLLAIINQRLVRRICPACAVKTSLPASIKKEVEQAIKKIPASFRGAYAKKITTISKTKPCKECRTGYHGQVGIYEVLFMSKPLVERVGRRTTVVEIQRLAETQGMLTLREDALLRVLEGTTTLEEVTRISGE